MPISTRSILSHRSRKLALTGGLALTWLAAAAMGAATPQNQLQQPGNRLRADASLAQKTALPQGVSRRVTDSTALGHLQGDTPLQVMSLELAPTPAQAADLDKLIADQQNPASPYYHKWLTPAEYGTRFGVSDADLQVLQNWLTSQGLQVLSVAVSRNRIQFSGSASVVESAFNTSLGRFQGNGQTFFENSTAPQIPAAFTGIVTGIHGLSSYRMAPQSVKRINPQPTAMASPNYTSTSTNGTVTHYLTPYDIRQIYGAGTLASSGYNGTGISIGVIGQSAVDINQLAFFQTLTGQPVKQPQLLLVPGTGISTVYIRDEGESEADLEYAGGVSPGANLVFIYTGNVANTNVITALEYAITNNSAQILNLSYGGCEIAYTSASLTIEPYFKQANAQGQTILVSSGDAGAASCENAGSTPALNGLAVSYPASSPYVTAVGGTTLSEGAGSYWASTNNSQGGSALSYIPEVTWNDTSSSGLSSSGGGASKLFSKPNWQTGPGVPADSARDVPDVAFSASVKNDPYLLCTSDTSFAGTSPTTGAAVTGACTSARYGSYVIGGTSLAAPSFAGMLAAAVQASSAGRVGNINPRLYALAQGTAASAIFHDIASGNNIVPCAAGTLNCGTGSLGYTAGTGYDQATGLGSINIAALSINLVAPTTGTGTGSAVRVPTVTIEAASSTGTTTTYNITVASTSSSTVPSGSVNVTVDGGTPTLVTLAAGVATYSLTPGSLATGNHTITAAYAGDANFATASSSLTISTGAITGTLSLSLAPASLTVTNGSKGSTTVALTSNGYAGLVTYTLNAATGSPTLRTGCFLGTSGLSVASGGTVNTTITYSTLATDCTTTGSVLKLGSATAKNTPPSVAPAPLLAVSLAGSLLGACFLRRRKVWATGLLGLAFSTALLGVSGCGSSTAAIGGGTTTTPTPTTPTTAPGTYSFVLTATSYPVATVSTTTNLTLTFQ